MLNNTVPFFLKRYHYWFAAILFLALNFFKLDHSSMYLDEAYSLFYARQDFDDLSSIFAREANPPLHFILLYVWVHLFGASVMTGRLLSLLLSAILVAIVGKWLSKHFGGLTSAIFCILFISSSTVIDMSMELRTFSLTALFVMLSVLSFIRYAEEQTIPRLLLLGLYSLIATYAHLTAVFPVAIIAITLLFRTKKWKCILLYYFIIVLGTLPIVLQLTSDKLNSTSKWMSSPNWDVIQLTFFELGGNWWYVASILFALFFSLLYVIFRKKESVTFSWGFLLLTAVGSWGISIAVSQYIPVFGIKYIYYSLPLFFMILAITVGHLGRKLSPIFKGLLVLAVAITFLRGSFISPLKSEDWKGAVAYILEHKQPGELVVVSPVYMYRPFSYYYDYECFATSEPFPALYEKEAVFLRKINEGFFEYNKPDKIYYLGAHQAVVDPNWENIQQLNERYVYLSDTVFMGINLFEFEKRR